MHTRTMRIAEGRWVSAIGVLLLVAACTSTARQSAGPSVVSTSTPTPAATPSATPGAIPAGTATIEPGTYRIPKSAWSAVDFTVSFPEGWTVQNGRSYRKDGDTDDGLVFDAVMGDTIYADACEGSNGDRMGVGPSASDLAAALLRQQGPLASGPIDTTLGGYPAIRIDLTVPEGFDLTACNLEGGGLQIWFSHAADGYLVLVPVASPTCTSSTSTVNARCS